MASSFTIFSSAVRLPLGSCAPTWWRLWAWLCEQQVWRCPGKHSMYKNIQKSPHTHTPPSDWKPICADSSSLFVRRWPWQWGGEIALVLSPLSPSDQLVHLVNARPPKPIAGSLSWSYYQTLPKAQRIRGFSGVARVIWLNKLCTAITIRDVSPKKVFCFGQCPNYISPPPFLSQFR